MDWVRKVVDGSQQTLESPPLLRIQTVGRNRRLLDHFDQQRHRRTQNACGLDQPPHAQRHSEERQHGFQPAETLDDFGARLAGVLPERLTRSPGGGGRHHREVERAVQGGARVHDPPLGHRAQGQVW